MLPSDEEFGQWLSLLLPDDENRTDVVALLTAMVDESGTHQDAPVLCVAACLASPHKWKALRKAWRPIITHLKKPYHATEHKRNPKRLNEQLAGLIENHVEVSVVVTVAYEDYKAATTPKFRSILGSEYSVAAMQGIFEVERWAIMRKKRWVAYVFEEGHKNSNHLKLVLGKLTAPALERRPFRIYSQTWLTKDEVALHAPDLVAFEVAASHGREPTLIRTQLGSRIFQHHMTKDEIESVVRETFRYGKGDQ